MMFRKIRDRFAVTLRTSDGFQFRGEFGDPNAYPRPRKEIQNLPHRALVTDRNSTAYAGALVTHYGQQYLLAGQHIMAQTKRFLALEINDQISWERTVEVIDPVTKMKKDNSRPTVLDTKLPVVREPLRSVEDARFGQDIYRIFTAAALEEGDLLDGDKVMRTYMLFGVHVAEVA